MTVVMLKISKTDRYNTVQLFWKCDDLLPSPKNWPNPLCLMMKKLKMWWPTPLPQELAQPSPLNDEKVKNVVTYSPSPRTGPTLSA